MSEKKRGPINVPRVMSLDWVAEFRDKLRGAIGTMAEVAAISDATVNAMTFLSTLETDETLRTDTVVRFRLYVDVPSGKTNDAGQEIVHMLRLSNFKLSLSSMITVLQPLVRAFSDLMVSIEENSKTLQQVVGATHEFGSNLEESLARTIMSQVAGDGKDDGFQN